MGVFLAGIDIGGTKCAVSLGTPRQGAIEIIDKAQFPTPSVPDEALCVLVDKLKELLSAHLESSLAAVGISCGGPLDAGLGLVQSPPNLPGWDNIDVVTPFARAFDVPCALENDANACGLAEWRWGAGKGCKHMAFLTFGTGLGAGLVLNGKLYAGANGMAGEVGHIRLEHDGPVGYGKAGSFEGFCSGGGIAQLAKSYACLALGEGKTPAYCAGEDGLEGITTRDVGLAAQQGDPTALAVFGEVARKLGQGLSTLIDILNPERIVIGSIFLRQEALLRPGMMEVLRREALSHSLRVCEIVPAGLGEKVGDYAALAVAMEAGEYDTNA